MKERLRWGILGTGNIARQFAEGVKGAERCEVVAVASRAYERAEGFSEKFGVPGCHESYDALLADAAVDAVYVSLPNALHYEWTLKALRAGKHVLCEKPFSTTAGQAEEMFDVAERAGRVLVEAFMYRSHPLMGAVLETLRSGVIGELRMIRTSFCFRTRNAESNVRFSTDLAGGGLMDIGCYCTNLMRLVAGAEPERVHVEAHLHASGVDDVAVGTLLFPGGVLGSFTCGMSVQADNAAFICGTEGYIEIPVPWKPPVEQAEFAVVRATPPRMDSGGQAGPGRKTFHVDAGKPLYALEADDFAAAVQDGAPPTISRADTVNNMRILDQMRQQIGLPF